jgi:rhodanese-related sulfurtransferase
VREHASDHADMTGVIVALVGQGRDGRSLLFPGETETGCQIMRLATFGLVVSMLLGVAGPAVSGEALSYDQVRAGVASNQIRLIDVREPDEFAAGHVPGAINLPLSTFKAQMLPPASATPIVLMCRSGDRASQALAIAEAAGRTDIDIYPGSMNEWAREGGAIVRP